jgi:hypothetical protein
MLATARRMVPSATRWRYVIAALGISLLAACATPEPRKASTAYSDDGVSELTAPDSWRTRPNLGRSATIRLGDDATASYLLVNSYFPHEVQASSFPQFAERVSVALMKRLRGGKISAPRHLTANGRPAVEYEISGASGDLPLVYLSTVVDGQHARHHLVAWTLAERYNANRGAMREAVASFRESAERRVAKTRTDLTFDWPERVTSTATVRSKSSKRGEMIEMSMRAVSAVRPLGEDQLLISGRVTDRKFTPTVKDKGKANYLERLLREAMTDVPDYVVDRDGEFVRVENLGPYLKRLEDALVEGLPEGPKEGRAKAQQLVRTLVTEKSLSALMQDEWNNIVGNWVDGSYVPGELYELQQRYQSPALGDQTFPMLVTQQLAGSQACRKGAAPNSCVRLLQTSRVSDPSFVKAMSAFVRKTLGTADVSVDKAEVVKTVEVIADPETLLPYRTVVRETKSFVVSAKGAPSNASEETHESITTYSY